MADERDKLIIENITDDIPLFDSDERRIPVRLLRYWDSIRGSRLFPSENDIDQEDISDVWDHCYLIQVNDLENRMKVDFTYLGSEILESYHTHLSEDDTADIISPKSSRLAQNFRTVIATKMPHQKTPAQHKTARNYILKLKRSQKRGRPSLEPSILNS